MWCKCSLKIWSLKSLDIARYSYERVTLIHFYMIPGRIDYARDGMRFCLIEEVDIEDLFLGVRLPYM